MEEKKKALHNVILENRKNLILSGVSDVDSFNEQIIVVYTDLGELTVKGNNLHINKLNLETGEMALDGEISSLNYTDNQSRNIGFFAKLFK